MDGPEGPVTGPYHLPDLAPRIQFRDGDWRSGTRHGKAQSCVQFVDIDVNIPETLTRGQPLPFGSPRLRPPRQPSE